MLILRRNLFAVISASVAVFVFLAVLGIESASAATVNACVKKKKPDKNSVKILKKAKCGKGYRLVKINQQGPVGPQGPVGTEGTAAPPGHGAPESPEGQERPVSPGRTAPPPPWGRRD